MPTCVELSKVSIEGLSRGTLPQVLLPNRGWEEGALTGILVLRGGAEKSHPSNLSCSSPEALAELISGGGTWNLTPSYVNTFTSISHRPSFPFRPRSQHSPVQGLADGHMQSGHPLLKRKQGWEG